MGYGASPVIVPRLPAKKAGVAVTGTPGAIFTVSGGRIFLWSLFGNVTTVIGGTATSLLLRANPTTGSDTDLCAAGVITSAPVGSLFAITGTTTDALTVVLATQGAIRSSTTPLIIQPGTIDLIVSSGGTTGAVDWYAAFDPVDAGATLVAA